MKKCIVLDLDNTLWGGVVGEDGIDGLQLSVGGEGASFIAFQQVLLDLYHRGVILAINSANNETDAGGEWRVPYSDYFSKKFTLPELIADYQTTPNIGLNALITKTGFLNDGSFYYGEAVHSTAPDHAVLSLVAPVVAGIHANRGSYEYGTTTDASALNNLSDMLAFAKSRDIDVIGFIPPYQPAVYDELVSANDGYAAEVRSLPIAISQIFSSYGYQSFDFTNASTTEIPNTEFIDAVHTTDKGSLRMFIELAEKNSQVRSYVSQPALQSLLQKTSGDFVKEITF
jgi:HAD superfamily phosphatase (TIGR01681 family)